MITTVESSNFDISTENNNNPEFTKLVDYINSTSNYSDKEFEILSTIRYDPNLSSGNSKFDKCLKKNVENDENVSTLDVLSQLLDFDDVENTTSDINLDKADEESLIDIYFYRFLLLGEHLKRIQFALRYFYWNDIEITIPFMMDLLIKALPIPDEEPKDLSMKQKMIKLYNEKDCYKMRFLIKKTGEVRCEAYLLPSTQLTTQTGINNYFVNKLLTGFLDYDPTYTVYIYDTQIIPSCFTSFKTTFRDHYTKARDQMMKLHEGKEGPCEILIFNTSGELMEGSITNCYIRMYMGDNWLYTTPALSSGCLCGVMRSILVSKRVVTESKKITIHQLKDGDEILLSNGVMGLFKGKIVKPDSLRLK